MKPSISFPRWATQTFVLVLCVLLIVHVYGIEAFVVPTGSMAPALAGNHRAVNCPCCRFRVLIGRHGSEANDGGYCDAVCPNCGTPLDLTAVPEAGGDHILVNKSVFLVRRPRRWEIVVFRLFGKVFVKRVIGLPGEWILIDDGDVFIDNTLARKTLAEFKQVRVLVFDDGFHPLQEESRWERTPSSVAAFAKNAGPGSLLLGASSLQDRFTWLNYRNSSPDTGKVQPLTDECSYNGSSPRNFEEIHDFMVECDVEVRRGAGKVGLRLTDGQDTVFLELPVTEKGTTRLFRVGHEGFSSRRGQLLAETVDRLVPGNTHHIEFAFVDRRISVALDGTEILAPVDLPPARKRQPVTRPVSLGIRGVEAVFRNVRLYRDLHYTQAGSQGVRGKAVHLGPGQYFVLGDNSPNSEDSRFWPGEGKVPGTNLMGKPFLLHLPSRVVSAVRFGRVWQFQLPDWERVRWLR